jgi:cytochrome c5
MMRILVRLYLMLLMMAMPASSQTRTPPPKALQDAKRLASQKVNGQEVFEQNCGRCHNSPSSFSPRISGTIARHMRVRAGLSKTDEQAILRFLNP